MTAIAIQYRDEIIQRVAQGEYLASIAQSYNLKGKGQSISDYLANDPEYQAARERGLENKLSIRESQLEAAEPAHVPRARELLSHARWRAEREAPHRWGQTNKLQVEHLDRSDDLRAAKARLIEGEIVDKSAETVDK